MTKNLIYIIAINDPTKQIQCKDYAKYSILTWEYYCKKFGLDLLVIDERLDEITGPPIWHKELIWKFGQGYDKIAIVDSDTMVRWDAPNLFDLYTEDEFCGVNDLCDLNWLFSSINDRKSFFKDVDLDLNNYVNTGVLFFGKKHLSFWKDFYDFYIENQIEIDKLTTGGKEQTLLNFFLQHKKVNIKILPPSWNLISIHKKNMFQHNWQLNIDQTPYFLKYAYVWHFTGFPIEDRIKIMSDVWNYLKENYV